MDKSDKHYTVQQFMDEEGRFTQWPSKKKKNQQLLILELLSEKFDKTRKYSEREVNDLLNQHHTFGDSALLRREMFEKKILIRTLDCRSYWINEEYPSLDGDGSVI